MIDIGAGPESREEGGSLGVRDMGKAGIVTGDSNPRATFWGRRGVRALPALRPGSSGVTVIAAFFRCT